MSELFRQEAIDFRRQRLYGAVIIRHSSAINWAVAIIVAVSVTLIVWAGFAEYARVEIVPGTLVTTRPLNKIYGHRPGLIEKLLVREGQLVNAGQILAIVTVDARTSSGELTAGESLVALERQITIVKSQASILERSLELETTRLKDSLSKAGDEAIQLAEQERLQTGVVASSEKLVEVIQPLVEQGVISRLEHERRKQALLQERQKYHQLNQSITQNASQRRQFEIQLDKALTDSEKQISDLRATLQSLEQQRSKLKADVNYAVTAPASGRISALRAAEGKSIDPKIPLLAILPVDAVFEAELYVAARAIGFIDAGQTVRLMYDAFPYRRFGTFRGKITQIAKSILNPADMDAPIKLEEATYQVRVELDDQAISAYGLVIPLQAGMSLQASVVLERRSFVGLLIEPLRAVRARS